MSPSIYHIKTHLIVILVAWVSVNTSQAQEYNSKLRYSRETLQKLSQLKAKAKTIENNENQKCDSIISVRNIPRVIALKKGNMAFLERFDGTIPRYIIDHNEGSAITIGTNKIQPRGSLGFELSGEGLTIGQWENMSPLSDHVEFGGRVTIKQSENGVGSHASHTMGTMIASGVNPEAKGMAVKANGISYSASGDISEMTQEAALGLLVSSHSYGAAAGWEDGEWRGDPDVSTEEDYIFGFYDGKAQLMDLLANAAPYYLAVWSAGNDRNDSGNGFPPDGPYDCIEGEAVAKNGMTVGAVTDVDNYSTPSSVVMSSFSSWGPMDDGRVKPDIVAAGVDLLSADNDNTTAYTTKSGTSMSTPSTAGSLLLLQELYYKLHKRYMKSATLKGLALHTTKEAGLSEGPDYSFGWGLLDMEKAVLTISEEDETSTWIREQELSNQEKISTSFSSDGNYPITISITWNDPAANALPKSLDPSDIVLINDLDLRLIGPGGTKYLPYILDKDAPSNAATKGDNVVDNTERIYVSQPLSGTYTVEITHKGTLLDELPQDFSLFLSSIDVVNKSKSLHWIGGSGNWSDGSNWSLTNGGNPSGIVPSSDDRAIFNASSFNGTGDQVNLNSDIEVGSILWSTEASGKLKFNGNDLKVNGSLQFLSQTLEFVDKGDIRLLGTSKYNAFVIHTTNSDKLNLIFEGQASSNWILNGPINSGGSMSLESGYLDISDMELHLSSFKVSAGNNQLLNWEGATIYTDNLTVESSAGISGELQKVIFNDVSNGVISASNYEISKVEINNSNVTLNGDFSIKRIHSNSILNVNGNVSIDSIKMEKTSSLTFASNASMEILKDFEAIGESGSLINIAGSNDGNGLLSGNEAFRFCFDYLQIENVDASGSTLFVTGINSTLVSSAGWVSDDCSNLLFSGFNFENGCSNANTVFTNLSTGNPTSYEWNFGDPNSSSNTSSEANPLHIYDSPGTYEVTLKVSDETSNHSDTQQVEIVNSDLEKPLIEVFGDVFFCSVNGVDYQWYRDGVMISGATERSYKSSEPGIYTVEISNGTCKNTSDPFVITSLASDLDRSVIIYPNPFKNHNLSIRSINDYVGIITIDIFDSTGSLIEQKQYNKLNHSQDFNYPLGKMVNGLYLVKISFGNRTVNKRLLINQ